MNVSLLNITVTIHIYLWKTWLLVGKIIPGVLSECQILCASFDLENFDSEALAKSAVAFSESQLTLYCSSVLEHTIKVENATGNFVALFGCLTVFKYNWSICYVQHCS